MVVVPFDLAMPDNEPRDLAYIDGRVHERVSRERADKLGISMELGHKTLPAEDVWWPIVKGGGAGKPVECPFGPVGGVLAVKERWRMLYSDWSAATCVYEADDPARPLFGWNPARSMRQENVRTFLRLLSIDLRQVGTMTAEEVFHWTGYRGAAGSLRNAAEIIWDADNPARPWPDAWAWMGMVERVEP
jgi:hypothetical protein